MTQLTARLTQTSFNTWILKFVGEVDSVSDKSHFFTWLIDEPTANPPRPLEVKGKELSLDLTAIESGDASGVKLTLTIQRTLTGNGQPAPRPTPLAQVTFLGGWLPSPDADETYPFSQYYPVYIPETDQKLTRREVEILVLVAGGATNRAIAEQLVISRNTVKTHLKHLLYKLEAASRTQVVSRARELGVI
jgi:DNA-binding CsgD family transcriptional regulator